MFSIGAELVGLPEDRNSPVFRSVFVNRDAIFPYLRFLLSEPEGMMSEIFSGKGTEGWEAIFGEDSEAPPLESMVNALTSGNGQLHDVARLLERLDARQFTS